MDIEFTDKNGAPVNLNGARIVVKVKRTHGDASPVILKDSNVVGNVTVTSETGGTATINFKKADPAALAVGQYVYDVWAKLLNGDESVYIDPSPFFIDQSVGGSIT